MSSASGRMITIGLDDDSFGTLALLLVAGVQKGTKCKVEEPAEQEVRLGLLVQRMRARHD